MMSASDKVFSFGNFRLDLRRGCLRADDREIELRPKSFEVLCYLLENAGRLVPKDEIMGAIWPGVTVTDESLTRCVSDIRHALGQSGQDIIRTAPRRGYVFAAEVSRGVSITSPARPGGRAGMSDDSRHSAPFSLLVLPFVNLGGDQADENLVDVITEGLTTYLSRIRDAFVISRSIAMTYKGRAIDVRQVGREVGVRYVLEGSAQHAGPLVRVSAQLIEVETGAHLWAERFDASFVDLLQMQDEVVTRLARALQIELTALESATSSEDVALAGETIYLRFGPSRRESARGFELCRRALQVDPDNVRALAILAEQTTMRVTGMQSTDREADISRSEEFVNRALAADPNSYHAHHAKARLLVAQGRADEALIEAARSLRLNPGFIPSYLVLCQANLMLGRADEAIEFARKVKRLSPPDPYLYVFHTQEGLAHLKRGEDELAVGCLRQAAANNPEFPAASAYLVAALALAGHAAEAHEKLESYLRLPDTRLRTVAAWRRMAYSQHPSYLAMRERIYSGLGRAGMQIS